MGAGMHLHLIERLHDLEKTIALLNQRVIRLQQELSHGPLASHSVSQKGSCLRALLGGWRQNGMPSVTVRQNRRVERHAAPLF